MLRDRVAASVKRIGLNKLEGPIFYNCPVAIRFEIGNPNGEYRKGKPNDSYVRPALQRVSAVYQNVRCTFDTLLWTTFYPYGDEMTEKKLLGWFCEITKLPLPQEQYSEVTAPDNEQEWPEKKVWYYWDIKSYSANIERLFEEILKADLGGFREVTSSVFLLDTDLNVLFYLYDDRGLDVAAESYDTIAPLYKKYGDWILENISGKTNDLVPDDCVNYDHIKVLVLAQLASVLDVSKLKKDEQHGYYIIDSKNDLWLDFCGNEVIINYFKEHHHIMGMDYEIMDEWTAEVIRFLGLLINRTVKFEFYFHGKKQIRVKVYSINEGKEELIEHIRTTLNPFLLNSRTSRKEINLIEFKQQ